MTVLACHIDKIELELRGLALKREQLREMRDRTPLVMLVMQMEEGVVVQEIMHNIDCAGHASIAMRVTRARTGQESN